MDCVALPCAFAPTRLYAAQTVESSIRTSMPHPVCVLGQSRLSRESGVRSGRIRASHASDPRRAYATLPLRSRRASTLRRVESGSRRSHERPLWEVARKVAPRRKVLSGRRKLSRLQMAQSESPKATTAGCTMDCSVAMVSPSRGRINREPSGEWGLSVRAHDQTSSAQKTSPVTRSNWPPGLRQPIYFAFSSHSRPPIAGRAPSGCARGRPPPGSARGS